MSAHLYDFTALDTLERCEEEFVRRYVQHLQSTKLNPSTTFGSAVHAGVKELRGGKSVAEAQAATLLAWPAALGGGESPDLKYKAHLNAQRAMEVVEAYAQAGHTAQFQVMHNEQYLGDEASGYCGIVDEVSLHVPSKQVVVADLKTTGLYVSNSWTQQFAHSAQVAGYLDLAETVLGVQCDTFWLDAVHVDSRRGPRKEDFFRIGPFTYNPQLRVELRSLRAKRIERARYLALHPEEALKSPHSCFRYNNVCGFFKYCGASTMDRDAMYQMAQRVGDLEVKEWKPEERRS